MPDCVVGVDLGGTNVRACAYYENGEPAGRKFENPSRGQDGVVAVIDAVAATIQQAIASAESPPKAFGLAIPGHVDHKHGIVRWSPNFGKEINGVFEPWKDVPVREPLSKLVDLPMFMDNDANMAALGEYRFGTGNNSAKAFVMFTLGTGIGSGIILSPESVLGDARGPLVVVGGNHGGAELGHTIINADGLDCTAGTYGTLEAYCQRDAIIRRAQYKLQRGRESLMTDLVEGDFSRITPRLISEACDQGDVVAQEVFREIGTFLGVGIANAINTFAPEILVIGGQVSKAGKWIMEPAVVSARNNAISSLFNDCTIVAAKHIEDAGMLGGAALALEGLKWNTGSSHQGRDY
ncbi:MAG: ROK family protein [Armatimonadetes bacterium]|nr:ROK family protein [Armatimonadota bacterium]MBS1725540.1 ROK family protein [Armatimonadota bacterium]